MPSSPAELQSGLAIFGVMALVAVVASLATLVASWLLIAAYRKRVGSIMAADAITGDERAARAASSRALRPGAASTGDGVGEAPPVPRPSGLVTTLHRRIIEAPWRHSFRYATAGACLIYALAVFQPQPNFGSFFDPYRVVYMFWTFSWPIVLAISIVSASSSGIRVGLFASYFGVLVVLGALATLVPTQAPRRWGDVTFPAWSAATPILAVAQWAVLNLLPTAAIVAFRHRRVRAVGPLVLAFMTVVVTGLLSVLTVLFAAGPSPTVATMLGFVSNTFEMPVSWTIAAYFLVPGLLCCGIFAVIGWRLLLGIRSGYQRKAISDQSLSLDAIWLTFGFVYATFLGIFGPGWVASGLPAFLIYKLVIRLANRRQRTTRAQAGYRLLLLRVFSLGRRTETLFDRVINRWRYVGSVQLIAGTDLAGATVAPHHFLSFLSGRLGDLFIGDDAALKQGIRHLDTGRDADGRYRVNDFFCYADTWQSVLSRLIGTSDVVLMDLRSFSKNNAGCIFELKELVNVAPAGRVVLLVDATTDLPLVRQTLDEAWREMRPDAPNRGMTPAAMETVWLHSLKRHDLDRLLRRLCHTVETATQTVGRPDEPIATAATIITR